MENKPLSEIEWTTVWMSIYHSACINNGYEKDILPRLIILNYYHRLNYNQTQTICSYILTNIDKIAKNADEKKVWLKFCNALNYPYTQTVELLSGVEVITFQANGNTYSLEEYLQNPEKENPIPHNTIVAIKSK